MQNKETRFLELVGTSSSDRKYQRNSFGRFVNILKFHLCSQTPGTGEIASIRWAIPQKPTQDGTGEYHGRDNRQDFLISSGLAELLCSNLTNTKKVI